MSVKLTRVRVPQTLLDRAHKLMNLQQDVNIEDGYIEVIGNVLDATTIKMLSFTILGPDLGVLPALYGCERDLTNSYRYETRERYDRPHPRSSILHQNVYLNVIILQASSYHVQVSK